MDQPWPLFQIFSVFQSNSEFFYNKLGAFFLNQNTNIIFLYLGKLLVDATAEVPPKIEVKWLR